MHHPSDTGPNPHPIQSNEYSWHEYQWKYWWNRYDEWNGNDASIATSDGIGSKGHRYADDSTAGIYVRSIGPKMESIVQSMQRKSRWTLLAWRGQDDTTSRAIRSRGHTESIQSHPGVGGGR
mmetsp:Transcript_19737/g.40067  ORF Transcript_19737/g.40067 Transcript_19737/m.40067 type:complete len:122 (+) Transcript_19737:305-670(+)